MGVPVTSLLKRMYEKIDPVAQKTAKEMGATCERSCSDCCSLLATMTLAEGVLVAENILKRNDWRDWIHKLVSAAKEFCYVGITKANYFDKKVPCVFLGQGKLCQIYEDRPATCRYHYVVSDPTQCSPGVKGGETAVIDMLELEKPVWALSIQLGQQLGMGLPICGPIPLVVLGCIVLIIQKGEDSEFVIEAVKELPTPTVWMQEYATELIKEGDSGEPTSDEDLKAIKDLLNIQ